MSPPAKSRDDADSILPGVEPGGDERSENLSFENAAHDALPERDRWTRELPLDEPAPGLSADFLNDITQIYLNEIGQHLLLKADEELSLARAMKAGEFAARQK